VFGVLIQSTSSSTNKANYFKVENNVFEGGGIQLDLNGGIHPNIINNEFLGTSQTSIHLNGFSDPVIKQNKIAGIKFNLSGITLAGALEMHDCSGNIVIEKNIFLPENDQVAVRIISTDGSNEDPAIIANNFISSLQIGSSNDLKVCNNNFFSEYDQCLLSFSSVSAISVLNNAFLSAGAGNLICSFDEELTGIISDYNAFYSTNPEPIRTGFTSYPLTYWIDNLGYDQNSIFTNIDYTGPTDLHIQNSLGLLDSGTPLPYIQDDIDGDMRSDSSPDIGADEFDLDSLTYRDIAMVAILSPDTNSCEPNDSLIIQIRNKSFIPIESFEVQYNTFNSPTDTLFFNQTISPLDTVILNLGYYNFAPSTGYEFTFNLDMPNNLSDNYINDNNVHTKYSYFEGVSIFKDKNPYCSSETELYLKNFNYSTGSKIIVSEIENYGI
jgi:hypothetical protein